MNPKLRSSVSRVDLGSGIIEFFKSNTRSQIRVRVGSDTIPQLLDTLDGTKSVEDIAKEFGVEQESLVNFLAFLRAHGVLDNVEPSSDFEEFNHFRRVIFFLEDYATSHHHLVNMWSRIRQSTVLIAGLGAVGSWVACNLAQSGVRKFILIDPDTVDISNLHRQFGYTEKDVGRLKVDAMADALGRFAADIHVEKIAAMLSETTLPQLDDRKIDLIINCADQPTVDITSKWCGEYGLRRNIPHIIGGGYNLHISLVGQTIIPHESACVLCFEKTLTEENKIDPTRVKKLQVRNRKVGSLGPLCALNASMIGMEAIKILSGCTTPSNINRRGEFDVFSMDVRYKSFAKRDDCEWCGVDGKYRRVRNNH